MSDAADDDRARADIGIVCALPLELAGFLQRCERVRTYTGGDFTFRGGRYDDIRIVVVEAGAGRARAQRAARALIEAHHPPWLLSCGFSGALRADVAFGQIVVANRLVAADRPEVVIDVKMPANPAGGLHVGTCVTTDHIVRTVAEKQALGDQHQALAVDMESHAVAEFCRDHQQRCLVVRVISDDMTADLPAEIATVFGATGATRFGAVVGALWKRPSSASDLWRLREQAGEAAEQLANFLDGVLTQLHRAS